MSEKKHTIPPTTLALLIAAGLLAWTAVLLYKTLYPGKTEYEKRLESTVDFMVGKQAADLDEAKRILAEADELLRIPNSNQREYHLILGWLAEYHGGELNQAQKDELVNKKGGTRITTWEAVKTDAILRAYTIMHRSVGATPPDITQVGREMKEELERIEKANNSEFNAKLDALRKGLGEGGGVSLDEVNAFLADEAAERARHTTLMSMTISVPYLIDMLNDDSEKKRTLVYDAILRIIALAESADSTITEPTDKQIAEVRALFTYDPKAAPEERRAAIAQIRKWTETGINKNLYPR